MASAADRFTRLEKLAIFLIALGEERTREILADVDMDTLQHLNGASTSLGKVGAEEKAAVMLEFAHFFYADEPLASAGVPLVDTDVQTPPKPLPQAKTSDHVKRRSRWIYPTRQPRRSATKNKPFCTHRTSCATKSIRERSIGARRAMTSGKVSRSPTGAGNNPSRYVEPALRGLG